MVVFCFHQIHENRGRGLNCGRRNVEDYWESLVEAKPVAENYSPFLQLKVK